MYNYRGILVPIEINTNVGMNSTTFEERKDIIDFTIFRKFIESHTFTKLTYLGNMTDFHIGFQALAEEYGLIYDFYAISGPGRNIPDIEDTSDHLIVRSCYDLTAVVDEEYAKIKTNFMKLIQNEYFGQQFAYINDMGNLINNITIIRDNEDNPNFILKSVLPKYDRNVYPKFFKVSTQEELNIVINNNVTSEYFLMEFHYNKDKLFQQKNIKGFRSYNLLFPPNLESISLGQYTILTSLSIDGLSTYNSETYELNTIYRNKYITNDDHLINAPKLLDTDQVEMMDGTFKSAIDLQIGDMAKTVVIPNPNNVDVGYPLADFGITLEEFESGATYESNLILNKIRIDKLVEYVKITFTDGTTWEDTINSSYLSLRNNDVRYLYLNSTYGENGVQTTDQIILVNSAESGVTTELKTLLKYEIIKIIFSGWELTIDKQHNFLTKSENSTASYVAIEHNAACSSSCNYGGVCGSGFCCPSGACLATVCSSTGPGGCNKTYVALCCGK